MGAVPSSSWTRGTGLIVAVQRGRRPEEKWVGDGLQSGWATSLL
jgi:hypothetical protein